MPPALVASFAFAVLPMSWGKWPDVLVDFGQQLYVPWRLSEGDVLYRDVAYLHGPLSQYVNALLFRLLGVGFWTLAWFNLATTALLVVLLYRLFERLGGVLSATVASLLFLSVFAFGQPLAIGNYNYVTPYVHEITHGAVLALAGIWALARLDETGRAAWAGAAGLFLGLAFLTKAETFAASLVADGVFLVLLRARLPRRALPAFAAAALGPPFASVLLFATALPTREALLATLGPFRPRVLLGGAAENVFFLEKMGLTQPGASLGATALAAAAYALLLVPAYLAARFVAARSARLAALLAAGLAAATLAFFLPRIPWLAFTLPFALVALAVAACAARRLARAGDPDDSRRERLRLVFAVFALALLPKILLTCVVVQYGFVLAMPVTLLAADSGVSLVPALIGARGGAPALFRGVVLVTLAAISLSLLALSSIRFGAKTVPVGSGRDAFLADVRGLYVDAALAELARIRRPGETFAAVPEGSMLSYLARLPNPTPYTNLMPTEVTSFGEDAILAAFEARPPDLVAVVQKSTAEYGLPLFGTHYAHRLGAFLDSRYEGVARLGAAPLRDERFGIAILRRKRAP
jgi:hypothetical protein